MSAMSPFSAARSISSRPTRQVSRRKPQREIDAEEMGDSRNSMMDDDKSEMAYKKPRRQPKAAMNPLITW